MAATKTSQQSWQTNGGEDFLQLRSSSGTVVAGIDSTGAGYGALAGGGGSPAGVDQSVQFNDGGSFGGSLLLYDKNAETLSYVSSLDGSGISFNPSNSDSTKITLFLMQDALLQMFATGGAGNVEIDFDGDAGTMAHQSPATTFQGGSFAVNASGNGISLGIGGQKIGFLGATPILRPTATDLATLLTALTNLGLITSGD